MNVSLKWTFILNEQYMRISYYRFIASTFNRNADDTNFKQNSVTTVYLQNVNIRFEYMGISQYYYYNVILL